MLSSTELSESASPRDGSLRESGAAWALLFVALAGFLLHVSFLFREPVDDAGISVAYARTIAEGHGLRVNPESAAAEGFSNPSWTFVLVLLELAGIDSVTWLRPLGVGFAALGLFVVALWGPAAERRPLRVEDSLGPLVAAAHPSFVHWTQGGLELGIQLLGIALLGLLALAAPTTRRAAALGAAAALVVLTRPEGGLYAAAAGSGFVLMMLCARRRPGKLELYALLTAVVPVLSYVAFRRWYFSEWLPNTYFSKHAWDFNAPHYLRGFFDSYSVLSIATWVALPISLLSSCRGRVRSLQAGLVFGSLVFFAFWAKGDWMREWRFLAPVAPFQGALIGAALSALRGLVAGLTGRVGARAYVARVELTVGLVAAAYAAYRTVPSLLARSTFVQQIGWDVSITLPKGTRYDRVYDPLVPLRMTHPLVVASDMGVIALGMRDTELWDFAGLTDPAISHQFAAKAGGLRFGMLLDYMQNEGPPTVALAWGPANFFPTNPMAEWYDEIAPRHYLLKGVTPERDPRCPGSKAAILATPIDILRATIIGEARAGKAVQALARWRCAYTYRTNDRLPSEAQRKEMAIIAARLAERADREKRAEPALRLYSLCAVLSIRQAHPSTSCRKRAEQLRAQLFGQ